MKKYAFMVLVIFASAIVAKAQEKNDMKASSDPKPMVGYLVDEMCGSKMAMSDVKKSNAKAARHTKDCALSDHCKASGYGLVSGGKFYKFDDAGDQKAVAYLDATKKESKLKVSVVGTLDGDKLKVTSISDAGSGKKKQSAKG